MDRKKKGVRYEESEWLDDSRLLLGGNEKERKRGFGVGAREFVEVESERNQEKKKEVLKIKSQKYARLNDDRYIYGDENFHPVY